MQQNSEYNNDLKKLANCHANGEFEKLLILADSFIKKYPKNVNGYNAQALAYKALGNFDKAKEIFTFLINNSTDTSIIHSNLANLYFDIGQINNALEHHKKTLSIEPNHQNSLNGAGLCLSEMGKDEEAIKYYTKALENNPQNENSHFNIATSLRKLNHLKEAAFHYGKSSKRLSKSFQLECLYTDPNATIEEFNNVLDELIKMPVNPLAACLSTHASIRFSQDDKYPFCSEPFDFIKKYNLYEHKKFNDALIEELLNDIKRAKVQKKAQALLNNGVQTSGNLFLLEYESIKKFHSILTEMVDQYKSEFSSKKEGFLIQWPNNSSLWGWIIILSQGGNLDAHMHKEGWLSSSIYFERPERKEENEGDIKFSLHGAKYPKNNKDFPEKIIKIEKGDMVIFPSSIFHSTIPFQSQQERITFAFDVIPS